MAPQARGLQLGGLPRAVRGARRRRGARSSTVLRRMQQRAARVPRRRRRGRRLAGVEHAPTSWRASRRRSAATTDDSRSSIGTLLAVARSRTCSIRCFRRRRAALASAPSSRRPHAASDEDASSRCARSSSTARRESCRTPTTPSSRRATPQRALDAMRGRRRRADAGAPVERRGRSGGARVSRAHSELRALRSAARAGRVYCSNCGAYLDEKCAGCGARRRASRARRSAPAAGGSWPRSGPADCGNATRRTCDWAVPMRLHATASQRRRSLRDRASARLDR